MANIKQKSSVILITVAVCSLVFSAAYFAERYTHTPNGSATEVSASLALYDKHRKLIANTLIAASTEERKLDIAADVFLGSHFMHTLARPKHCNSLGVPIDSFVSAYKEKHYRLFEVARRNEDEHNKLVVTPSDDRIVALDMKDAASMMRISEQDLCRSFEQYPNEWANTLDFKKTSPETAKVLLSMGELI